MSTPSLTPSPPPAGDPLTVPDRPAAKAGLLLLVLLMLGLLLWQMSQELRQQEGFEHERAAAQLDRLNDRLSLTLELKARTALALLPGVPPSERGEIQNRLLPRISDALPQVRQLQWVDSAPQTGSPSPETTLPEQLRQHAGSGLYHYCLDPRDGESLYLTLREPGSRRDSGFWLLHLASDSLAQWSPDLPTGNLLWRLEDQYAGRVLWHTPGSTALLDDMQTLPPARAPRRPAPVRSAQAVPNSAPGARPAPSGPPPATPFRRPPVALPPAHNPPTRWP